MTLVKLALAFSLLALMAVGGGTAVLPEIRHVTVDRFHWLTDPQFRDIYSLGQVAPGPNMTMVLLIGYRTAGALGALVVGVAFFLPDCALALIARRIWDRFEGAPWREAVQHGMAPVAVGLMASGTFAIARLAVVGPVSLAIALASLALLLWRRVNPALLVLACGALYAALASHVHLPH